MSRVPKCCFFSNSDEKTLLFWNYAYISSLSVKKLENKICLTNFKKSVGFWLFLWLMHVDNFTFWKIPVRDYENSWYRRILMSRVPKCSFFSNSDEKTLLFWNYAYISSLSVKKVENKFSLTNLKKSVGFWLFLWLMIDDNFTFWKTPVRER